MAPHDVRMRGFAERKDVDEVDRLLGSLCAPLAAESVDLLECVGRVLAEDVIARVDVPGFARSAMDGYALRCEDTVGASERAEIALALIGDAFPGRAFGGRVGKGEAVRIMTGAPIPDGADAVVRAEACEARGGRVHVREPVTARRHIGEIGEDIRAGERVLRAERRIRPQDAGLLASIGCGSVSCVRRPRVRLVITGDELLAPGSTPAGVKIVDSNSVVLRALVARDGGALLPFEPLPDRPPLIAAALTAGDADVVLVSGGSSVGAEDHAPRLLAEHGELLFHGVSMRPSSPAGGGRIGDALVFLLPGNPVSCLCAYEFFAGPALRALGGRSRAWPHRRATARLARELRSELGRTDYVRVSVEPGGVVPLATAGASILSSTVRADGAVIVPKDVAVLPEGAEVEVLLYDDEG